MATVPLIAENVNKCMCPSCPVQSMSRCARDKMKGLKEALKASPLVAASISGVYCAGGKAACADLDFKKPCLCESCLVYTQYKLKTAQPNLYYCRDGAVK